MSDPTQPYDWTNPNRGTQREWRLERKKLGLPKSTKPPKWPKPMPGAYPVPLTGELIRTEGGSCDVFTEAIATLAEEDSDEAVRKVIKQFLHKFAETTPNKDYSPEFAMSMIDAVCIASAAVCDESFKVAQQLTWLRAANGEFFVPSEITDALFDENPVPIGGYLHLAREDDRDAQADMDKEDAEFWADLEATEGVTFECAHVPRTSKYDFENSIILEAMQSATATQVPLEGIVSDPLQLADPELIAVNVEKKPLRKRGAQPIASNEPNLPQWYVTLRDALRTSVEAKLTDWKPSSSVYINRDDVLALVAVLDIEGMMIDDCSSITEVPYQRKKRQKFLGGKPEELRMFLDHLEISS